jgi:HK97 family phage prohead protease
VNEKEIRQVESHKIEVREIIEGDTGQKKTIGGYAVKYNSPTIITDRWGDSFLEEFAQGAFDESLKTRDQKSLWNHKSSMPLGSVSAGTLRFNPDTTGLNYEVDLPNTSWGNDAYESIKRGDVDGSSFGFICLDNQWSEVADPNNPNSMIMKRTVTKATLTEVSPCTFPAYDSSEMSVRSFDGIKEELKNKREAEELRKKLILETLL